MQKISIDATQKRNMQHPSVLSQNTTNHQLGALNFSHKGKPSMFILPLTKMCLVCDTRPLHHLCCTYSVALKITHSPTRRHAIYHSMDVITCHVTINAFYYVVTRGSLMKRISLICGPELLIKSATHNCGWHVKLVTQTCYIRKYT